MTNQETTSDLIALTAEIVRAHVSHNTVALGELPELVQSIHKALATAGTEQPSRLEPAVSIRRSITPNYIICLEDGRKLKMLKRHLRSVYDMSPDEYREKWGLRPDYPMVAPAYSKQRSEFAKAIGLGQRGQKARRKQKRK